MLVPSLRADPSHLDLVYLDVARPLCRTPVDFVRPHLVPKPSVVNTPIFCD